MSRGVVKRRRAVWDLDEIADHVQRRSSPERAIRFLESAETTFRRLARPPRSGTLYDPHDPLYAELSFFPVSRFKSYLVFYRPIAGGIEVIRVLHGARDIPAILAEEFGEGEEA